jgi:hypothetical protein
MEFPEDSIPPIVRRLPPAFLIGRPHPSAGLVWVQRVGPLSFGLRPSTLMWPGGASMVLGHFAETKGPRLPGRNPTPLEQENNSPAMSLTNKKEFFPEHHGNFLKKCQK